MFEPTKLDDADLEKYITTNSCDFLAQDHPTKSTILTLCDALVEYEHRNGAAHWIDALVPAFINHMEEIENGPPR